MTKQEQFLLQASNNYLNAVSIMERKSADYAQSFDPFKNFRACEILDVSIGKGILVRCLDKISRINNLLEREAQVKDESIEQTLLDTMNYFNIILIYLQSKEEKDVVRNRD